MVKIKAGIKTRQNKLHVYLSWLNTVRWGVHLTEMTCSVPNKLNLWCMHHSRPSEANQEISKILCSPKGSILCSVRNTTFPALGQMNPATLSNLTSWRLIFTLPCHLCLGLSRGLFCARFTHKISACTSLPSVMCHILHLSHLPSFNLQNNIWWAVQIIKCRILKIPPDPS